MNGHLSFVLVFLGITVLCIVSANLDGCQTKTSGCSIQEGTCVCSVRCPNEHEFQNRAACLKALRANTQTSDICNKNPCRHNGSCSQISQEPRFVCRCEGTGYYGQRCQYECPKPGAKLQREFPFECIVI